MKNTIQRARGFVSSHRAAGRGATGIVLAAIVALWSGVASATTYDPTSALTTFANSTGTSMGPIVLAVAGGLIGIALLFWGVRAVYRLIKSSGSHL